MLTDARTLCVCQCVVVVVEGWDSSVVSGFSLPFDVLLVTWRHMPKEAVHGMWQVHSASAHGDGSVVWFGGWIRATDLGSPTSLLLYA